MYLAHFRLDREPFSLTPDPRFLFLSARHREALAHLLYGLEEKGGFLQLTGEVGAGKTTLCRSVLDTAPAGVDVALILNPRLTAVELLATICDELGIPYAPGTESLKVLVDCLNRRLLEIHARGRRAILIVDEAQQLSADVLEQIRLLSNLETATAKLLQIVLIGQPELQTLMARPELRQLAQRISARYHLGPLSQAETAAYVRHRLAVAGCVAPLFTSWALRVIHRRSRGIPRLVNALCDRALLGAYARGKSRVGARLARAAALEVEGRRPWSLSRAAPAWGLLAALAALAGLGVWRLLPPGAAARWTRGIEHPAPASVPTTPAPALPRPSAVQELADLLARGEGADPDLAYAAVFERWGLAHGGPPGRSPCDRAAAAGLRCLQGRGGWDEVAGWDLPAVLELRAGASRGFGAVLSLRGGLVSVAVGGRELEVFPAELQAFWTGAYTLLWQPPPGGTWVLREGAAGARVLWLREQLDRALGPGGAPPADPEVFDAGLRERLVAFQRSQGLRDDGRAGVRTFLRLAAASRDGAVPNLRADGRR